MTSRSTGLDLFERPESGERAVLVHIDFDREQAREERREFIELVRSAGVEDVALVTGSRYAPDPRCFVGAGKAEEIRHAIVDTGAEVVIFNHALTPSQERSLEGLLERRVLDRTSLILDIFAQRARSHEGKLQVELAQLRHMSSRLVRGWTHLERQKGGIGLRGPGEKQIETDRRLLGARIKAIEKRLDKVDRQRDQGRQARRKAEHPTVSLVGYTNAGKSTLFNRLADADVYQADKLFATLDPTLRRVGIGNAQSMILADTVGFIRHLPHDLVAAFKSTLQETREAELLLHVVDAADPKREANIEQVDAVLDEIGAGDVPRVLIFNKIDLLDSQPRIEADRSGQPDRVWLSATSGAGVEDLLGYLGRRLGQDLVQGWIDLPPNAGKLRSRLFSVGAVKQEEIGEDGASHLHIELPRHRLEQLSQEAGLSAPAMRP